MTVQGHNTAHRTHWGTNRDQQATVIQPVRMKARVYTITSATPFGKRNEGSQRNNLLSFPSV